jgi:Ca-activated chloride channel family protein
VSSRVGRGPAFAKPRSKLRKWLPALFLLGAVGCLVGAFLQFRISQEATQATVILVFDASNSMDRTDVVPSRLVAAQEAARSFLEEVPPDFRVGLVTFANTAIVRSAPTLDRAQVRTALDTLTTEKDTVIGDGLDAALDSLQADWEANGEGPAAVLLLSDGRDTGSVVTPIQAASRAQGLAVPVFTVLLGEAEVDEEGVSNAVLLEQMAETTGAQPFNAETAERLNQVYENLGTNLSTRLAVTDIGTPFLIGAGVLGLAAGIALVRGSEGTDWR